MERLGIPVGVYVGSDRYVGMAHQLFGHIKRHSSSLEICAESMPQAVGGKISCDHGVDDLVAIDLRAHMDVQGPTERAPPPVQGVVTRMLSGPSRENRREGLALGRLEEGEQGGVDRDIPDPCCCFGPFDRRTATLSGGVDVDLVVGKVNIRPGESCGLAGAHAGVEEGEDPKSCGVLTGNFQNGCTLILGDGAAFPVRGLRQLQQLRRVIGDEPGLPGPLEHLLHDHAQLLDVAGRPARLTIQDALQVNVLHILQLHASNGWLDVPIILLTVHGQALCGEPHGLLVSGKPLVEPSVHRHGAGDQFLTAFGRSQLLGQLGHGLNLSLARGLILLAVVPGGLSYVWPRAANGGFCHPHTPRNHTNVRFLGLLKAGAVAPAFVMLGFR